MSVTPNFSWPLIEPTDFVTDLPADFETFADAVDADLAGLLGGTTGQVLTKDSASDHDFSWQDPAGGGDNWTLLNTGGTALTGASTITVSGISNQAKLLIAVDSGSLATADSVTIRFNGDTGTNYNMFGETVSYGTTTYGASNWGERSLINSASIQFLGLGSAAELFAGYCLITGCNTTGVKVFQSLGQADGNNKRSEKLAGWWNNSASITSVSLISSGGNFDAGTVYIYGTA